LDIRYEEDSGKGMRVKADEKEEKAAALRTMGRSTRREGRRVVGGKVDASCDGVTRLDASGLSGGAGEGAGNELV
jgi:hypothetical protein